MDIAGGILIGILIFIILFVGFSALSGLILWGCARGIGKVENATYLNSWGLFWILSLVQFAVGIVQFLLQYAMTGYNPYSINYENPFAFYDLYAFSGISIFLGFIFYGLSILIALGITKGFWKCTLKQAFMTHLIPMIVYLLFTVGSMIIMYAMIDNFRYDFNHYDNYYNNYNYDYQDDYYDDYYYSY